MLLLTLVLVTGVVLIPISHATEVSVAINPIYSAIHIFETFAVNVTLTDVSCLYGWEISLYWNRSVLTCIQAEIYVPSEWFNNFTVGPGVQNDYNSTHGRYFIGLALGRPSSPFNGTMRLVTVTFEAVATGSSSLDLVDTELAYYNGVNSLSIPHTEIDGNVSVLPSPLYMRSDQHTVNNATMYKLISTQTGNFNVTSTSSLDPENEWICYWGFRVWKRSGSGTETEITSGSPVATVSRATSGQGLQYSTWSCPATNLSGTDCLVVRVYYSFDVGSWIQCAQFSTTQLNATALSGQTWTVYYYTSRSYNSQQHKTYMYYYWDNTYGSRIENVSYS